MKEMQFSTSNCRHCRFYEPEGRRGGSCQILGVPVQSRWEACALAAPPFDTTLKKLEDIFQMDTAIPVNSSIRLASKVANLEIKGDRPQIASPKFE
jgi:hypothetical protein